MNGYKTSKDYKRLKELVESGIDVVCFVTWDFDCLKREEHEPMWVTDVCYCRYLSCSDPQYTRYMFVSRGHGFGDYWPSMDEEKYTFEEYCEANRIEFIEPTEKQH